MFHSGNKLKRWDHLNRNIERANRAAWSIVVNLLNKSCCPSLTIYFRSLIRIYPKKKKIFIRFYQNRELLAWWFKIAWFLVLRWLTRPLTFKSHNYQERKNCCSSVVAVCLRLRPSPGGVACGNNNNNSSNMTLGWPHQQPLPHGLWTWLEMTCPDIRNQNTSTCFDVWWMLNSTLWGRGEGMLPPCHDCLYFVGLQTILRFSQSRRRPLLLLRHYAK